MTQEDIIKLGRLSGFTMDKENTTIVFRLENFANLIELHLLKSKTLPVIPSMTMRDHFAAQALQGVLAGDPGLFDSVAASRAYGIADEMLKARGKK